MVEKKLTLLLPAGEHLASAKNWNVYDIMESAGIGRYSREGKHITFTPTDSSLEVKMQKPRNIPWMISTRRDNICGVTSRDIVSDSIDYVQELYDLKCSHVDLAFAVKEETFNQMNGHKETNEFFEDLPSATNLERFLVYSHFIRKPLYISAEEGGTVSSYSVCCTQYPRLAEHHLRLAAIATPKVKEILSSRSGYNIVNSDGITEDLLNEGIMLIFDTVATGDSLKKREAVILEKSCSSTAGIYLAQDSTTRPILDLKTQMERIVRGTDDYAQFCLRLPLVGEGKIFNSSHKKSIGIFEDTYTACLKEIEHRILQPLEKVLPFLQDNCDTRIITPVDIMNYRLTDKGGLCKYEGYYGTDCYNINGIITTKDIPILLNLLRENKMSEIHTEFFNLDFTLGYCPRLIPSDEDIMKIRRESSANEGTILKKLAKNKFIYPCMDLSKLRPEHRAESLIASMTKEGGIYVNPKYKSLY